MINQSGMTVKRVVLRPFSSSLQDLALGQIVEFLSHTPYWKNMAILVTQDDAGGEPDHIDAQRSVLETRLKELGRELPSANF